MNGNVLPVLAAADELVIPCSSTTEPQIKFKPILEA